MVGSRRLAAIMFTDTVGSTAAAQADESRALARLREQEALLRPLFVAHGGREIKSTGDGFLIEFESALRATQCAIEVQRRLHERNSQIRVVPLEIRIGIHVGEVERHGFDIFGDAVNVASRIEPFAGPGGICLSSQAADQVLGKIPAQLHSIGPKDLKGVRLPLELFRVELPWSIAEPPSEAARGLRLAVLPFQNMSSDPNDAFFADGMTEELITTLSKIRELTVLARTSVMRYKSTTKGIGEIAKDLRASQLIEGSVRKSGSRIRITVQLLDASTEGHLWAEHYDRDLADIFEIQTDVARQVSEALRVRIRPAEQRLIEKKPTENREAYFLYLKGRYHWNRRTPSSVRLAIEYFEKAIDNDPSFALALVGLADCYQVLSDQGDVRTVDVYPRILDLTGRASALDSALGEPHATRAAALTFNYSEWDVAESEFRRSLELNPAYPTAHHWYSLLLSAQGRPGEALEQMRRALELDPLSSIISTNYALKLAVVGRNTEAVEHAKRSLALDDRFAIGHFILGIIYLGTSDLEPALSEFRRALAIVPDHPAFLAHLGRTLALLGRQDGAREVLAELGTLASKRYVSPGLLAVVEFSTGAVADAVRHLEEAYADRSAILLYLLFWPGWADLWRDERTSRILSRIRAEAQGAAPDQAARPG